VDKKRQLLDAAERVYCQNGNLGLTVRRLAAEADTTSQTIYTYFGSRDAVIVSMYERAVADLERLLRPLGDELRAASAEHPQARLMDIALAYRRYCLEHPAHFKMLAEGVGPEGTDPAAIIRLQAQLVDLVEQAQLAAGIMPRGMNDLGARQAIAPLHGLIQAELSGFLASDVESDTAMRGLIVRLVGLEGPVSDVLGANN
jgi:AcrR family transcriptional regulator